MPMSEYHDPTDPRLHTRDLPPILQALGWRTAGDEVGDRVAVYDLPDRRVQIIYGIDAMRDPQALSADMSLTTAAFDGACSRIGGREDGFHPLVRAWKGIRTEGPEITPDHVRRLSEQAIAWAEAQDLDAALREHAALPTDAPGARPVWHLAALSLLGDAARLARYRDSFAAGDRLGFVPYVTADFIDRAADLCAENTGKA